MGCSALRVTSRRKDRCRVGVAHVIDTGWRFTRGTNVGVAHVVNVNILDSIDSLCPSGKIAGESRTDMGTPTGATQFGIASIKVGSCIDVAEDQIIGSTICTGIWGSRNGEGAILYDSPIRIHDILTSGSESITGIEEKEENDQSSKQHCLFSKN